MLLSSIISCLDSPLSINAPKLNTLLLRIVFIACSPFSLSRIFPQDSSRIPGSCRSARAFLSPCRKNTVSIQLFALPPCQSFTSAVFYTFSQISFSSTFKINLYSNNPCSLSPLSRFKTVWLPNRSFLKCRSCAEIDAGGSPVICEISDKVLQFPSFIKLNIRSNWFVNRSSSNSGS